MNGLPLDGIDFGNKLEDKAASGTAKTGEPDTRPGGTQKDPGALRRATRAHGRLECGSRRSAGLEADLKRATFRKPIWRARNGQDWSSLRSGRDPASASEIVRPKRMVLKRRVGQRLLAYHAAGPDGNTRVGLGRQAGLTLPQDRQNGAWAEALLGWRDQRPNRSQSGTSCAAKAAT